MTSIEFVLNKFRLVYTTPVTITFDGKGGIEVECADTFNGDSLSTEEALMNALIWFESRKQNEVEKL